jgi:hypothetical protein
MAYVAPATPPARKWYGYQLMLSDLGSLVTAAALSKSNGGTAGVVGVAGFVAVPAVIHGVHRNVTGAIVSPIVRLGLPVMGALIGAGLESCSPDEWFCGLGGAIVGGGIGMLTAMILDYSLAWEHLGASAASDQPTQEPPRLNKPPLVSLTAAGIAPTTNGATLVLGGRF